MKKILISINPEHVDKIILGIKKYEYRTRVAKDDIESIIVYCTFPIRKVIAEVEIVEIIKGTPEEVWELTKISSGITKEFYDKYFKNRAIAYSYKLGIVLKYDEPKELIDFGVKSAPQSFVYLNGF